MHTHQRDLQLETALFFGQITSPAVSIGNPDAYYAALGTAD